MCKVERWHLAEQIDSVQTSEMERDEITKEVVLSQKLFYNHQGKGAYLTGIL